jgi:MFS family permease
VDPPVVDFTLYLRALSWPAVWIGVLFAAGMLFSIGLTLALGPLSDRLGRKRFLLGYEAAQIAAAAIALATSEPLWLGLAAVVGSYGRGANGATGPFSPVEQAWLAAGLRAAEIAHAFRRNVAAGFAGMAAGSVVAILPGAVRTWLPAALAYRPIFALAGLSAATCFVLLCRVPDDREPAQPDPAPRERRGERRRLAGLAGVNVVNGLGISMVGPFIAYWFHLRFGVGPQQIGPVMAAGFVLAGLSTLATGRLIARLGLVDTVVVMRLLGLAFLLLLPFSPSFGIAAALHILRSTLNRSTAGARQALTVQLVSADRRGLAATLGAVSSQIPRALGPLFGGYLFDYDLLAVPFIAAALFQGVYLALYRPLFRCCPLPAPTKQSQLPCSRRCYLPWPCTGRIGGKGLRLSGAAFSMAPGLAS